MESSNVCKFCTTENGKYKCPRCNIFYCSLLCYQSEEHAECSEQFYKECIKGELKLDSASPKDEKQMQKILNRIQNESFGDAKYETSEDSDDEVLWSDFNERLQNINLDDVDATWSCLTDREKEEFQTVFESGDISKLVDCYEPWWSKRYENKIEDLHFENKNKSLEYIEKCPQIGEIIPFDSLCKTTPAPCVIWNIMNVLAAYSLISRCYLGDHYNSYAVNHVLIVCKNLNSNSNFHDMATAIESVKQESMKNGDFTINGEEASSLLFDDVSKIMLGPEKCAPSFYILAALSDLHSMFVQCINEKSVSTEPKTLKNQAPVVKLSRPKLKQIAKKLNFYMSWVNAFYKSVPI